MAKRRGVGDDINKFVSDIVSPWLGSGPRTPPQVQRGQQLARTLVEQADQFGTGGLGRAAMAGPSELAKQAAYNAAAAAAGMGAVKVVQKTVAKVAPRLMQDVGLHMSDVKGIKSVVYDEARTGSGFGPSFRRPVLQNVTYKFSQYGPKLGSKTGVGEILTPERQAEFWGASQRRMAYVTRSPVGRVDPENPALSGTLDAKEWFDRGGKLQSQRITGPQRVVAAIERKGTNFSLRESQLINEIKNARAGLEADRAAMRASGAVVGFVAPKKPRGGGTKKR